MIFNAQTQEEVQANLKNLREQDMVAGATFHKLPTPTLMKRFHAQMQKLCTLGLGGTQLPCQRLSTQPWSDGADTSHLTRTHRAQLALTVHSHG